MSEFLQQTGLYPTNMDLIYCIDATASMTPHIQKTKEAAKTLYRDMQHALENSSRRVEQLRLKVIVFRDFSHDGEEAIKESQFFNLPDEAAAYEEFINDIEAKEGGEFPESSLEALHLAINSEWDISEYQDDAKKRRHVIVLFTDDQAHMLDDAEYREKAERNPLYPKDCPKNLSDLVDEWKNIMNEKAKRLVILAPNKEPWGLFEANFSPCVVRFTKAADGLDEITNDAIMDLIARTLN